MTATELAEQQAIELLKTLSPESRSRVLDQVQAAEHPSSNFAPGYDEIIARRIEEIESGNVEGIPYEEAMQKLRARLPKAYCPTGQSFTRKSMLRSIQQSTTSSKTGRS